jgi:hypothetical protein
MFACCNDSKTLLIWSLTLQSSCSSASPFVVSEDFLQSEASHISDEVVQDLVDESPNVVILEDD